MSNIMSMKKVFNKTSRNGFDLSEKNIFSAKIGELLPAACIECIPGDKFKINTKHFTRTMPVNTAAYTRIREYYDWFFVPTNLLWNKYNTFFSQMGNNNQNAANINTNVVIGDEHPYIYSAGIHTVLNNWHNNNGVNLFGYSRAYQSCKLLEYLDYGNWVGRDSNGNYTPTQPNATASIKLNPFPLLAYQKIYSDYYRNSQWEDAWAPAFNINYLNGSANDSDKSVPITATLTSDNPYTMLDLHYVNWNKDMFLGVMPNSQYGDAASINIGGGDGTLSLSLGNTTAHTSQMFVTKDSSATAAPNINNNVMTSGQAYGDNTLAILTDSTNGMYRYMTPADVLKLRTSLGFTSSSVSGSVSFDGTLSILALRNAEAMQKWKEITQSHSQDFASQMEAHFGVKVSDAYSERCKYIGGDVSTIDISEVVNTNLADNNAPDIAGKGVGTGNGFIDFETKVPGYLMCIYHAVPILDYGINGIKKRNLKTKVTDYVIPEFDRTGMVQVPSIELMSPSESTYAITDFLGYAPRYYDYKTSYDKVRGAFTKGGRADMVAPFTSDYIDEYFTRQVDQGLQPEITYQFFKVNPATMNPIFVGQVSPDSNGYATDQLLINTAFDIKAVRNLDVDGLPY